MIKSQVYYFFWDTRYSYALSYAHNFASITVKFGVEEPTKFHCGGGARNRKFDQILEYWGSRWRSLSDDELWRSSVYTINRVIIMHWWSIVRTYPSVSWHFPLLPLVPGSVGLSTSPEHVWRPISYQCSLKCPRNDSYLFGHFIVRLLRW